MDEPLTEDIVRHAYRLILGRAPESDAVVQHALRYGTVGRLRDAFLNSVEFERILHTRPRLVQADAPPLPVALQADDAEAARMLAAVRMAWDAAPAQTEGGEQQAADLAGCLRRNGLALPAEAVAFELGCGAGRVSRHLAGMVGKLIAADASPRQLAAARRAKPANVTLRVAEDLRFGMNEPFDLWYSWHALQHSPPPLIARALASAFVLLKPGGVAIFQLPTYAYGYSYPGPGDLHVLPQRVVFSLAAEAGCVPLEVFDDLAVGPSALWRSSTFVLRKRTT